MERTAASPERVYRLAAALGSELQRLSSTLGPGAVAGLVPSVVGLLEALEAADEAAAAGGGDPGSGPVAQALEQRLADSQQRARLLQSQLAQAEEQNQQLLAQLASSQAQEGGASQKEREVMLRLKEVVDRQRDELRAQAHEIACKSQDTEALQEQLSRFMSMNEDLRRKLTVVQAQLKSALEKNADLEAAMLEARREAERSSQAEAGAAVPADPLRTSTVMVAEQVPPQGQARTFFSREELEQILQERHELKTNLFLVREELAYYQRELLNDERIPGLLLDAVKAAIKKQRKKIRAKMLGTAEEPVGSGNEEEEEEGEDGEGESTWLASPPGPDCVDSRLPASRIKNFFGHWYRGGGKGAFPQGSHEPWEIVDPGDTVPEEEKEEEEKNQPPTCTSGSPRGSSPVP